MIVTAMILSMATQAVPAQNAVPGVAIAPSGPIADPAVLRERANVLRQARATLLRADAMLAKMPRSDPNRRVVEAARRQLAARTKELEKSDKLSNVEIQRLMQSTKRAETLTSSVAKKDADTAAGVIDKMK